MSQHPTPENTCANCKYSSRERPQPNLLQNVLVCRYGPPTPILIPAGPSQVHVQPMFPIVGDNVWCHRHESYLTLPKDGN